MISKYTIKYASDKKYINYSSILLYLLPIGLLTGSFIPDLLIVIISIFFLYLSVKNKLWVYFSNNFFYIFIGFYAYILLNSLFSENIILSLESSLFYFRYILFSLSIWFLVENNKELINNLSIAFLLTFIFAIVDGYWQFTFGSSIFGYKALEFRMTLSLNDKMILGSYLARLFPLLAALIIYQNKIKNKFLLIYLLLILVNVLVFLSGERTAIALQLMSTILIIILVPKHYMIKSLILLISLLIIVIVSYLNQDTRLRNLTHTINQLNIGSSNTNTFLEKNSDIIDSDKNIRIFSTHHESMYNSAFKMFIENPFFGIGPKMYRVQCKNKKYTVYWRDDGNRRDSCSTHPHNNYFQAGAEMGAVGLLILIFLFFYFINKTLNHYYRILLKKKKIINDYQIFLIICFIITLWPIIPSLNFFNNWINIIYFFPVGFYISTIYGSKSFVDE